MALHLNVDGRVLNWLCTGELIRPVILTAAAKEGTVLLFLARLVEDFVNKSPLLSTIFLSI